MLGRFVREVDEEFSQAVARVIIVGISLFALCLQALLRHFRGEEYGISAISIGAGYWLFSLFWLLLVKRFPGHYISRRATVILGDLGVTSLAMYMTDAFGAAFYPLYLWIIVGNGMRYGSRYLIAAIIVGAVSFTTVLLSSPYWRVNYAGGIGLWIGIIVLPLFYLTLLNRLHTLNKKLTEELAKTSHAATHDALTGLINRECFYAQLRQEIRRAKRYGHSFAVFLLDLDGFKEVNDSFGHQSGDAVLTEVARRLVASLRESDVVARLGGDEFSLIIPTVQNEESAGAVSRKLIDALSTPYGFLENAAPLSVSIGISFFAVHGTDHSELIRKADFAMYRAKKQGKGRYICFTAEPQESLSQHSKGLRASDPPVPPDA